MEQSAQLINCLIFYGALVSVAFIISLFYSFKVKKQLNKNKNNYDLRNIRFFLDPVTDDPVHGDTYRLSFTYGEKVLHCRLVTDDDMFVDPKLPFKEFVAWTEEEYGR